MRRSGISRLVGIAAAALAAGPAAAQAPSVGFVFPPGGQSGTKAAVAVNGGNLQEAKSVLLAGQGVQAQITRNTEAGSLAVELNIAPDAVPGARELRVVTPRGVSNAGRFWVGPYPEANETEPNNTISAPQKLEKLPITVNGQINGGEDQDFFTFQAAAGETYVFDLVALRIVSGLDGYLVLTDGRGKNLSTIQEGYDRDPRLIYTFKTSGTYGIQVRDTTYKGGANFVYKLTLGRVPVVTSYLPMGGKPGETVQLAVEGANLGSMRTLPVQIPTGTGPVQVPALTPMGMAVNSLSLVASDLDEIVEAEPNDAAPQATTVPAVPAVLNGRMNRPGDVDLFRITPAAAGNLQFDLIGRRIGSRIESFVRILDAAGKELQANDDAVGKDSRLTFGVQAGTTYLVEVRSMDRQAGGEVFYRLEIRPPGGQDFALSVTPDAANMGLLGSVPITLNVTRINGFPGAITPRVEGLPPGVVASPVMIPAGANSTQFTLTAAAGSAAGSMSQIRIVGTGTIGGMPVERVAQPVEIYQPPMAQQNQNASRQTAFHTAAVMPQQAYALDIQPKAATVKRGQSVDIKITATRLMGQTAQINIAAANQPANVNPALQNIAANANEVTIKLNVAGNAPIVTQNVILSGNLSNNVQTAPAFTLTITE